MAQNAHEFRISLPVLDVGASAEEADGLWGWLVKQARKKERHEKVEEEIEHWALFRLLLSFDASADVAAREAEAREELAASQTRHATAEGSAFWSRDVDGRATNRHALRKQDSSMEGWNQVVATEWKDTLNRGEGKGEEEKSRVLQGTVIDSTATAEQQLRQALDTHLSKVRVDIIITAK